jgi:hypothetical protein
MTNMNEMSTDDYIKNGLKNHDCKDLNEYFQSLAEEYGLPISQVREIADLVGNGDLFDGLISILEDM